MTERCGNCRFWKRRVGDDPMGFCRRYPKWAILRDGHWCGEWTPNAMAEIERMGKETYDTNRS